MSATPRTIETVEELRALKEDTRLLGRDYKPGCARLWRVEKFGVVNIERPLDGICGFNYFKDPLPAIVLTESEAVARALDATQPRTISTVEELDALALGSVILGATVYLKVRSAHGRHVWGAVGSRDICGPEEMLGSDGATVLHEPEAEVGA